MAMLEVPCMRDGTEVVLILLLQSSGHSLKLLFFVVVLVAPAHDISETVSNLVVLFPTHCQRSLPAPCHSRSLIGFVFGVPHWAR